jgi:hypothetical protein
MEQHRRMLPGLLEFVNEGVLQFIERGEDDIGEVLAQVSKELLSGVQFWAIGWQIERMHILRPTHLATAMTARTVEHDPDRTFSQLLTQMLQEELQAVAFHRRQQEKNTCTGGRFHRRIEPKPLVLVLYNPGRTLPQWAPTPAQPGDQTKATFIHGHHVLECWWLYQGAEVFLKAAWCSLLAFLCRRRPVFHLTRCFLKSHQSDLPFL